MANITISEADFEAVAGAAIAAQGRGERAAAEALDKIARKINASLSNSRGRHTAMFGMQAAALRWQDVPSTLLDTRPEEWHGGAKFGVSPPLRGRG